MKILEVPELLKIPDPSPNDLSPTGVANFLMTVLFRQQPAMSHADFIDSDGKWFVRSNLQDTCVAEFKELSKFRSVLARFVAHFMDTQLYGGHIRRVLSQNGKKYGCRFFMSNEGASGFWIRVYAHAN